MPAPSVNALRDMIVSRLLPRRYADGRLPVGRDSRRSTASLPTAIFGLECVARSGAARLSPRSPNPGPTVARARPGSSRRSPTPRYQDVITPSTAAIGRSKKPSRLPSAFIIEVMKFSSTSGPSTMPRIAGAIGKPFSSMRKASSAQHQDDADAEHGVVDRERADDAEDQDDAASGRRAARAGSGATGGSRRSRAAAS